MDQYWTALISIGSFDTAGMYAILTVFNADQYIHDLLVRMGTDWSGLLLMVLYFVELISIGSFDTEGIRMVCIQY